MENRKWYEQNSEWKANETRLESQKSGAEELRTIKLSAVYGDSEENKKFFRWTPSGSIQIGTLNPETWKHFPLGAEVYVDFHPVAPLTQHDADQLTAHPTVVTGSTTEAPQNIR